MQSTSRMQAVAQLQTLVAAPKSPSENLNQRDGMSIHCKTSRNSEQYSTCIFNYCLLFISPQALELRVLKDLDVCYKAAWLLHHPRSVIFIIPHPCKCDLMPITNAPLKEGGNGGALVVPRQERRH